MAAACPTPPPCPNPAAQVLNREFLEMRCKILELAASLDRLSRGAGSVAEDPRFAKLREAIGLLIEIRDDRAEQVQLLFSRPYDDDWQQQFALRVPR
jgi:hypothetical protein